MPRGRLGLHSPGWATLRPSRGCWVPGELPYLESALDGKARCCPGSPGPRGPERQAWAGSQLRTRPHPPPASRVQAGEERCWPPEAVAGRRPLQQGTWRGAGAQEAFPPSLSRLHPAPSNRPTSALEVSARGPSLPDTLPTLGPGAGRPSCCSEAPCCPSLR